MATRFELVQDPLGKFHFQLCDDGGTLLLESLGGDSKIMTQNDLQHARQALTQADHVVGHVAADGTHFAVVKDDDGSVLARTPHVPSATRLDAMVAEVRNSALVAPLIDRCRRRRHA